jgi:serine/threonine-protein kinase RsbW
MHEAIDYFISMKRKNKFLHLDEYYFRLALDELVENALTHGNRQDGGKNISVEIKPFNGKAEISVTDEGDGFIPSSLSSPRTEENFYKSNGRGIFIVQKIGEVHWNDTGNRIMVRL